MSKNRILSLMLAALMCMSLIVPVSAASKPTLTLSGASAEPGDTVTLTVSIKDNPGISATTLYLYYDTAVFSVDERIGVKTMGEFSNGALALNSIELAEKNGRYEGKNGKDGMVMLWFESAGQNVNADGSMLTISMQVNPKAKSGTYYVELDSTNPGACNEADEDVEIVTVGAKITVAGGENEINENDLPQFDDVSGNWAEEYIMEAAERGIVVGDKGHYYPNDNMTRAEFVMILWRVMGSPAPKGEASFIDLTADWYKEPIAWAEENKIVDGYGDGIFDPNGNVTREQMMTILHRLAGRPVGMEMMFTSVYDQSFSDSANVSAWAKNAVY